MRCVVVVKRKYRCCRKFVFNNLHNETAVYKLFSRLTKEEADKNLHHAYVDIPIWSFTEKKEKIVLHSDV